MKRIRLFESSSTQLAFLFSGLLAAALTLLAMDIHALVKGEKSDATFTYVVLILISIITFGLFIISFYVTKRINTIAQTADHIMSTRDLSARIPIDAHWDDLSKLANVLNLMLEDIEQLLAGVRQVSDSIAHDLRTPLTRLRNHIESMRTGSNRPEVTHDGLGQLIVECDGLLTTFNALLRISNIESGKRLTAFSEMSFSQIVHDVIELYEPLISDKHIHLAFVSEPTTMVGDKDLLFQAIANLLDNAIKYTPPDGHIHVAVNPFEGGGKLVVSDTGPGISQEHKDLVFRRFYRVDSCRNQPGSGLGLSLVAAVINLHQGTITLSDNLPHGLMVTVVV
jgi:signal transduction histidine kinase